MQNTTDLTQLKKDLEQEKQTLLNLRFKNKVGQLNTTHLIKDTKKKIARILTNINSHS